MCRALPRTGACNTMTQLFYGNHQWFWGLVNQCCLLFQMHLQIYAPDQAKVALEISLLTEDVLYRASLFLKGHSLVLLDWDAFIQSVSTILDGLHRT